MAWIAAKVRSLPCNFLSSQHSQTLSALQVVRTGAVATGLQWVEIQPPPHESPRRFGRHGRVSCSILLVAPHGDDGNVNPMTGPHLRIYDIPGLHHAVLDLYQPLLADVDSSCSLVGDYQTWLRSTTVMGSDCEGRLQPPRRLSIEG